MNIRKKITVLASILLLIVISGCNTDSTMSANEPGSLPKYGNGNIGSFDLSQEEIDGLIHMRIEEKLARDVYLVFDSLYNYKVFYNISISEQTHMDAVKRLLVKYNIEDPLVTDEIGVFPDPQFQQLFDNYIIQGNISLQEALQTGVTIEEMDIADLENQLTNVVDNPDIIKVYQNLKRASENHLAAFSKCLQTNPVDVE
ncbi:MAG: DUF2202 domain-containing protein [Ignavibacteriales bacterium]|nr:MAG: DUF2202 domain-containing protein [Ignavibacteriales bacterium]